jgi:hypothetical protein
MSGHRHSGGTYYYQATKDSTTHFYFDRLAEGTHVIEYVPLRHWDSHLNLIFCGWNPSNAHTTPSDDYGGQRRYPLKVVHAGKYVAGFAEVESLYAKEFRSRSQSTVITAARL